MGVAATSGGGAGRSAAAGCGGKRAVIAPRTTSVFGSGRVKTRGWKCAASAPTSGIRLDPPVR